MPNRKLTLRVIMCSLGNCDVKMTFNMVCDNLYGLVNE